MTKTVIVGLAFYDFTSDVDKKIFYRVCITVICQSQIIVLLWYCMVGVSEKEQELDLKAIF